MKNLDKKVVLVTGAASGIGKATALAFAREGCRLLLVDIDEVNVRSTAMEINRAGGEARFYVADLREASSVEELHEAVRGEIGACDVLVNCAGVAIVGCAEEIPLEAWDRVLGLNLLGYINVIHHFLPDMVLARSGHLVNVASGAGLFAVPYQAPYVASKFAVVGLSETLRSETARYGIGVSVVCPGAIRTPILESVECLGFGDSVKKGAYLIAASPDKMAAAIISGVKRNKAVIAHPFYIRVLFAIKRLSPRAADQAGKAFARVFYWQHRAR